MIQMHVKINFRHKHSKQEIVIFNSKKHEQIHKKHTMRYITDDAKPPLTRYQSSIRTALK